MLIGNTDMHLLTFLFIIFETVMFGYQFILYLSRPQERQRLYYLILLVLLMTKNTASGLFPDPRIDYIPIIYQYILTYGAGFVMASYFPFYFYKAYSIGNLRWHATRGVFLFLHAPFFIFFAVTCLITNNIDKAIDIGLIIPALYGLILGYVILVGIRKRLSEEVERREYFEMIAVFFAVIPYASLAFCAYFRISQVEEVLLTNGGFTFISILFIRNSIQKSREEYRVLQEISIVGGGLNSVPESLSDTSGESHTIKFENGFRSGIVTEEVINILPDQQDSPMEQIKLSPREKEVATLLVDGFKYQEIGETLGIEFGTVKKHVENIYKKANVKSRKGLAKILTLK
jgi:DNA-binding CsgD family transcriptional regulator